MEEAPAPVGAGGFGFFLTAQVNAGVGAERVCALMNTALGGLVEALETAPKRQVAHIEVLSEAEQWQVLVEWNWTEAEYPADRCIHELFVAQAARTPGGGRALRGGFHPVLWCAASRVEALWL